MAVGRQGPISGRGYPRYNPRLERGDPPKFLICLTFVVVLLNPAREGRVESGMKTHASAKTLGLLLLGLVAGGCSFSFTSGGGGHPGYGSYGKPISKAYYDDGGRSTATKSSTKSKGTTKSKTKGDNDAVDRSPTRTKAEPPRRTKPTPPPPRRARPSADRPTPPPTREPRAPTRPTPPSEPKPALTFKAPVKPEMTFKPRPTRTRTERDGDEAARAKRRLVRSPVRASRTTTKRDG